MTDATLLLGREGPHGRLRALLTRAAEGARSVALVSGPAGIGKSSLVRAAVGEVAAVGWGTCIESEAAPGYWPWSRALDAVAAAMGPVAVTATAAEDAPLLARIGRFFGPASPSEGSERDRFLLMDAVSRWLARAAAQQGPLVVVLDDLHWADESSLALLDFVARDPAPAAVALIGCYRHDELAVPTRRRMSQLAMSATSIELGGLDRDAVGVLAAEIAGPLSAADIDDVFRRAGGHPGFTRELALLVRDADGGHHLPVAVRDAIEHRLAQLPDATREVLEVAALGGTVIVADAVAVAAALPRAAVDGALASARLAGIVTVDTNDHSHFAQDLYRETIVAAIPPDRRMATHQQLGAALEARAARGVSVHPADIAHHFTAAVPIGEASRAARWAMTAAAADIESLAFGEAAAHLRRWRESLESSPVEVDPREHATVVLAEADALARAGSLDDARSRLRSAHALTCTEPLADLRAEVALAFADLGARFAMRRDEVVHGLEEALIGVEGVDLDREARLTARLARELQHSVPADRPRAGPLSERAIALGRAGADPNTLVTCLLARHDVQWIPGAPTERIELAREIVSVAEYSGDQERVAEGNLLLANALLEAGSAAFEPALDESLRLFDRLGQPRHRYTAATRRAAILLLRGDTDAAAAAIEDAADLGLSIREPDVENVRMSQRLELVRTRNIPADLIEFAEAATRHWTGAPIHAHAIAAGYFARAGNLPAARHHTAIVADLGSLRHDRSYLWSVGVRELATAAIALDDRSLCEELLNDLAPVAKTCGVNGAIVAFAGSHGHVAGLLAAHLGAPNAGTLLTEAAAAYGRLGANAFLADLQAHALEQTGTRPGPFADLTAREAEVLVLIARGLSNDEIVAQLVVSPATVRNHITRIFQKLHVRNRAQAIVLAREAELA
ncbi:MAG TPA: AAA family ATPase [Acidimicrobiales bacterium]|nr:AAA family ATPase [Acidimicrobiales bacterium]